jgi:hypothetical protein
MGNELVKITPTLGVNLSFPDGMAGDIVSAAAMAVMGVGVALVKGGISAASAVVQTYEETKVKITFYEERGRYIREYIIPTLALYDAVQSGRNFINSSKWDDDLCQMALEDIHRILEKYRKR